MKILITGGAGFIGSNLAHALLCQGHEITIVDDFSTGRQKNIDWLYRHHPAKFRLRNFDISKTVRSQATNKKSLYRNLQRYGPFDQIYHLACPASPPKYYKNPLKTLDINYIGTKNVLEVAKYHKARMLFTSTSEVYGDPLVHPQSESYRGNVDPVSPRSVYDEGKRVAETLVSEYHRTCGVETKIARIFNTYGPRMDPDDGRVVTNFIKQMLEGDPITIYGTGQQTRSFCYVDDQVQGLIALMNCDQFINEPVNIGNPEEISMIDLAVIICKNLALPVIHKGLPTSDPSRRKPDISKMKTIGWEPKIYLQEGLARTIKYMKEELGI